MDRKLLRKRQKINKILRHPPFEGDGKKLNKNPTCGVLNLLLQKRVSFWSPEEMISPQVAVQTEPDHPVLHPVQISATAHQNADLRNHNQYQNYQANSGAINSFKYKSEAFRHQASRSGSEGESSASSPQKKPKKEIDSSKPYKCTQCEYSFNRRDHLTRHSLVHSKLKPYHCNYCSKVSC